MPATKDRSPIKTSTGVETNLVNTAVDRRSSLLVRILGNMILVVVTVVLSAMGLELAVRAVFARSLDFSMEMWKYAVQIKEPVANPRLSFVHAANRSAFLMGSQVTTNSHRLRDHEYSEAKPSDTYRIVMLGDSTTLGWGDSDDQTIPKILERELNATGIPGYRNCEVLNAGVGNYNTVQEVEHYRVYDRVFRPDLVVLNYFINDAEPVPIERHSTLLGRSYLVAFVISRYDAVLQFAGLRPKWNQYYADLYLDGRPGWLAAQHALQDLAQMTSAENRTLLVTIIPELHQINGTYPFALQHRKVKDQLAARNIPSIDLIEGMRGRGDEKTLWVTPADPHPNGKANRLIVEQILPWIIRRAEEKCATAGHSALKLYCSPASGFSGRG
jgi:lysophospholipase L1-like esterase